MKFEEALVLLREGKKIARPNWGCYAIQLQESQLHAGKKVIALISTNKVIALITNQWEYFRTDGYELTAEDWVVVDG